MKYDNVTEFNEATERRVLDDLQACCPISSWGDQLSGERPFPSAEVLVARADSLAEEWQTEAVMTAIASHARLGAKPKGTDQNSAHSRREQSGLGGLAPEVSERLVALQAAYLERFGHIFLVRAAGRGPEEILGILEERMQHTPEQEARIAKDELRQIALLRLQGLFG